MRRNTCLLFLTLLGTPVFAKGDLTPEESVQQLFHRFAYGARPAEVKAMLKDPAKSDRLIDQWFESQLQPDKIPDDAVQARIAPFPLSTDKHMSEKIGDQLKLRKIIVGVESQRQFQALLLDFWMNHFNIDGRGQQAKLTLPHFEDAIRQNMFGSFYDLLAATAKEPAMLRYLNNDQSRKVNRKGQGGINENYARELMELHTLGLDGGYTQDDVIALARILSGWTVKAPKDGTDFIFKKEWHDDGEKKFLGQTFPSSHYEEEGERALHILSQHPSTAKFSAKKLARAFIADEGNEAAEKRMADAYMANDGNLTAVYRVLFASPEIWRKANIGQKLKKPTNFVFSSLRALDARVADDNKLQGTLKGMGEDIYNCGPPTGYPDRAEAWFNANLFSQRLMFVNALANGNVPGVEIKKLEYEFKDVKGLLHYLEDEILQQRLEDSTRRAISSAFQSDGMRLAAQQKQPDIRRYAALALGSPQFQRR